MFEDDSDKDRRKQSLLSLRASAPDPPRRAVAARSFRQSLRPTRTIRRRVTGWRARAARRSPARCLRHSPAMEGFQRRAGRSEPKRSRWSCATCFRRKSIAKPDETLAQPRKPGWFSRKRAMSRRLLQPARAGPAEAPTRLAEPESRQLVCPAKSRPAPSRRDLTRSNGTPSTRRIRDRTSQVDERATCSKPRRDSTTS